MSDELEKMKENEKTKSGLSGNSIICIAIGIFLIWSELSMHPSIRSWPTIFFGVLFLILGLFLLFGFISHVNTTKHDKNRELKQYTSSLSNKVNKINKLKNKKDEELTIKSLKANKFEFLKEEGIFLMKPNYDKLNNSPYGSVKSESAYFANYSVGEGKLTLFVDSLVFISDTATQVIKLKSILNIKRIRLNFPNDKYTSRSFIEFNDGLLISSSTFQQPKAFIGFLSDNLFESVIQQLIRINI